MTRRFAFASALLLTGIVSNDAIAQTTLDGRVGVISTAVPFLRISPDARSGAMGDVGLAISPDANAQYWNVAKLAMSEKQAGISITYTPWLKDIVPDVFLGYLSGYYKFGQNYNQAISGSLRYFNLGDINYADNFGTPAGTGKPREFAFDIGYSRRLSTNLSAGVNLRYIHSNIAAGAATNATANYKPASTVAADAGIYYTNTKETGEDKSNTLSLAAVLSNIGGKISYTQTRKDFIPTNLGIGAAYTYKADHFSKITFALDLNKALVPAPIYRTGVDSNNNPTNYWEFPEMSVISGVFKSFAKAPPGYGTTISLGAEYWYQDQFAARIGYFYENKNNGARQYFTCGLGVRYSVFGLNVSYLVPSGSGIARNPLSNTLRFSLTFDFDSFNKKEG